jgi:3-oxoacyl-[acyl-carrier protein] reductase
MGYYVLVNYKGNEQAATETLAQIRLQGGDGELLQCDISSKEDIQKIIGGWMAANEGQHIEVLVNNAGIKEDALMVWMQDEQWDNIIKTNLDSFFYVTRQVLQSMVMRKYGRIINVVSLSGLQGVSGQTNYSAAKAGIIGASRSLAKEVGRMGITVNSVAPGFIKTDMIEGLDEKELQKQIPVRRFGLPEEVAYAVGFLAAKEAAYITGEVLSINGGI